MQNNLIVFPEPSPDHKTQLVAHAFPVPLTPLVGREQETEAIQALLSQPDVRLLTLIGTAGVGKTRLALEVARNLAHDFADGVVFLSLAPLSDPALVIPTIAHNVGIIESGSQPLLELLKTSQRDKHRLLLLDNFEQVIEASPLLAELLEACSQLKLLLTSREVLRLRGEHQFAVAPLAVPDSRHLPDTQSLARVAAVKLFIERAQAIQSDFRMTTDNAATIAEICIRLDGLPLAIELAATRIKLLPAQALLARLDQRLVLLTSGKRDMPPRQQTLRNTLAWSYNLLDAQEQQLFRCLSVFGGGCTLEAVEAVYGTRETTSPGMAGSVLDNVTSLLDKSLLHQVAQEGEKPRLVMLETIREYGLECLQMSGEADIVRQAHATYYLAVTERAAPEFGPRLQTVWLERLEQEHDNLRVAMQWLIVRGEMEQNMERALRMGAALRLFWMVRGYFTEGRSFLERVLVGSQGAAVPLRVKALEAAASLALMQGDIGWAEILCEENLALSRELGDSSAIASALYWLAEIAWMRSNLARGRELSEEALALWRKADDRQGVAWSLFTLATFDALQGEYDRARDLFEESLAMQRKLGNKKGVADVLWNLAQLLFVSQADPRVIRTLLEESLALYRELGDKEGITDSYALSGQLALSQGDAALARSLLQESVVLSREMGLRWHAARSLLGLARLEAAQGDYTTARILYEESLALCREVGYILGIALALEGLAAVVAAQGELAWAAHLWGAAEALREARNTPLPPIYRADYERSVAAVRANFDEQTFAAAWSEGRSMSLEQALTAKETTEIPTTTIAVKSPSAPQAQVPSISPAGLTTREMTVLRLLTQGLTSAQIAEQLVIGLVTVNSHVRSIYNKLGVTSRAAATRYALEHRLL